ncbi:MAG: dephospho-CoA kinase [Hylemonella sp.]
MSNIHRIGLTGGIGSGKSTVALMLAELGAAVIDADALSRQSTAQGGQAIEPIRRTLGPEFITAEGALDRSFMRAQAFADPQLRRKLEAIVHPIVAQETELRTQAALEAGSRCIVYDVPLLVESVRWRGKVDRVLVIDCSPSSQIERTVQRSGLSQDAVKAIMAAQVSREQRLRAADIVICNEAKSLTALRDEVGQVAQHFGL